jgi:hypothetical protein
MVMVVLPLYFVTTISQWGAAIEENEPSCSL